MLQIVVLICDDNKAVHETLSTYLRNEGMIVRSAYDGQECLAIALNEQIDFLILDIMLPKVSGIDVCRKIRETKSIPIIMLSAKGEPYDRIAGLELGADDYVTKPFSPREMVIRIKRILERTGKITEAAVVAKKIFQEGLSIDLNTSEVMIDNKLLELTAKEVKVLSFLVLHAGIVINREQLLNAVWGYEYFGNTRVVDTFIKKIRRKLSERTSLFSIQTLYGIGYRFVSVT